MARRAAGPGPQTQRQQVLDAHIQHLHAASDEVYRAPRITADLHEGAQVNTQDRPSRPPCAIRAWREISPRAFKPVTTIPGTPAHRIPDLVNRGWDTGELNWVWTSDITYLHTREGRLYLCVVRDGCSRRVLGWAMDSPPRFRPGRAGPDHDQDVAWSDPTETC